MQELNRASQLDAYIEKKIMKVLESLNLLNGQWGLGHVDEVISPTKLKVFVNGSTVSQTISCNPDVDFQTGDYVWVIFINGNGRDKFVISKRGI